MKDEKIHHGATEKSLSEQQTCVRALIFYIVRKNWPYPPTTSGSYGREVGKQTSR